MNIEWFWSASVLIILVVLIRFIFRKKIRPCLRYALWLAVAVRLLLPFSLSETAVSVLNLLPEGTVTTVGYRSVPEGRIRMPVTNRTSVANEAERTDPIWEEKSTAADGTEVQTDLSGISEISQISQGGTGADRTAIDEELPVRRGEENSGRTSNKDFRKLAFYVWACGAALSVFLLLAANLNYAGRLKRSRLEITKSKLPRQSAVPVYVSEIVQTPCLFGLFSPSVYVTNEVWEDEKLLDFVLCHENTHYIHKDHFWAFVRMLCFCLHWYNPFVWIAAYLSRQDGELACDEGVVKRLEDKQRIDYGKALLELSGKSGSGRNGWQISTTMGGSKLRLKERLFMILHTPKKTKGIQIILCLFMALFLTVTFTGRKPESMSYAAERLNSQNVRETLSGMDQTIESKQEGIIQPVQEFYEESISISLGEKDYRLICEGNATEDGLYSIADIRLVDMETDICVDTISTVQVGREYWQETGEEPPPVCSTAKDGNVLITDLNFDGWNDLCFQGWETENADIPGNSYIPYYCMLWNPEEQKFEYSTMLYNVETDSTNRWLSGESREEERHSVIYYRYDEENKLHMLRYVEKDLSKDAVFEQLDLTYVEDGSMYTLPAIAEEDQFNLTMIDMAKQALMELYQWTGEKIDTACFKVNNLGGVVFSVSEEDMKHSRVFFSRYYGADTPYNLSGYEKSISSIDIASGRSVWYSPVLFRVQPVNGENMTDEEMVIWSFERVTGAGNRKVKSIEQRYEDMWTIQTEEGSWFEVIYNADLREALEVTGPYPEYPVH